MHIQLHYYIRREVPFLNRQASGRVRLHHRGTLFQDRQKDFGLKFELYQRHRVREYWIVAPDAKDIHAWSLEENGEYGGERIYEEGEVVVSTVLDGFKVNAGELLGERD
jgi:Uncharacterized protein conserved in cyanobacteria